MSAILANVFLVCFIVGLLLTLSSLIFGMDHGGHHDFHFFGGHGHADFGGHTDVHGGHHGDVNHDGSHGPSFFSYTGLLMFLTWFGGVGYMLNSRADGTLLVTLLGALFSGLVGATAVFLFLGKFLMRGETRMDPRDYYLPGTLARVTSLIRQGGTGEIVYVQGGTRKTAGARSESGGTYKQGEEVVIVRYEKGIAYVESVDNELSAG